MFVLKVFIANTLAVPEACGLGFSPIVDHPIALKEVLESTLSDHQKAVAKKCPKLFTFKAHALPATVYKRCRTSCSPSGIFQ